MTGCNGDKLVSIVIPAYNAHRYIRRSVESALAQTYNNIELIVVDDGSTDDTAEIVKSYDDSRIRYLYQPNGGQGTARNNGIKNSRGDYITFLDADDKYLPDKVKIQLEYLQRNPEHKIVYCDVLHYYSDRPDVLLRRHGKKPCGDIFRPLLEGSLINPNAFMAEAGILKSGFLFQQGAQGRYCEEWPLYLALSRAGYGFGYVDRPLVVVEIRPDSNTQWDIMWLIKKHSVEMFEKLFADMSADERAKYNADKVLRNNRFKLAVAYLIGAKKKEFLRVFRDLYGFPMKFLVFLVAVTVAAIPASILRKVLVQQWKARQLHNFCPVK